MTSSSVSPPHPNEAGLFTEYWGDDFFHPVRDLKKIVVRYFKYLIPLPHDSRNGFLYDLLSIIPFTLFITGRFSSTQMYIQLL